MRHSVASLVVAVMAALLVSGSFAQDTSHVPAIKQQQEKTADSPDQSTSPSQSEDKEPNKPNADSTPAQDDARSAAEPERSDENGDNAQSRRRPSRSRMRNKQYSREADEFVGIFSPVVASAAESTVKVLAGSRQVAFGMIVNSDGLIMTKASELRGEIKCKLPGGHTLDASVFGINPETDLALLKIDAKELPVPQWSLDPTPEVGSWVASTNMTNQPIAVGIVSVNSRKIRASTGFMGILPVDHALGVRINRVTADSPAERANLEINDIVIKIDDFPTTKADELRKKLAEHEPGDRIQLTILRVVGKDDDGQIIREKIQLPLTLGDSQKLNPMFDRSNQQNRMGSTLSQRRRDFPMAFQHDTALQAKECGGPIVDLSGRVVGLNIARSGRVSSLALPSSVVLRVFDQLKTGDFAPDVVNKEAIASIDTELQDLASKVGELPEKKESLQMRLNADQARQEELERMIKDVQYRLKMLLEENKRNQKQLDAITEQIEDIEKTRERLEAERRRLATGAR